MAAVDVLKLVVDADVKGAVAQFGKLQDGVSKSAKEAEKSATTISQKFGGAIESAAAKSPKLSAALDKVGISGQQAGALIGAAIPAAGVAAAGALVAFAKKGVDAFQQTALAAGKFSDATGLSVESASRYVAIADDIGVGAGTIQNAFVKMEKAMGANKSAFTDLIATTKSGGTDLSQTFLNAITHLQGIKDPIQRATEASKLFGKGFAEVSELINTDAGKIKQSLADVSKSQVINQKELQQARDYRAAMDNLGDSVRDLSITLGQELVPQLTATANAAAKIINAGQSLPGWFKFLEQTLKDVVIPLQPVLDGLDRLGITGDRGVKGLTALSQINLSNLSAGTVNGGFLEQVNSTVTTISKADFGNFEQRAAGIGKALDDQAAAAKNADDKLRGYNNAVLAASGSALGVSAAQRDFTQSLKDTEELQKSGKASADELAASYDAQVAKAESAATATLLYAQNQATLHGTTVDAKQENDILIGSLYASAKQMSGPSQQAVIDLITQLQTYGAQHPDPKIDANTATAQGNVDTLQAALHTLTVAQYSARVGVDTSTANARLDALNTRLQRGGKISAGGGISLFAHGGMVEGTRGAAQLAVVHGGEYVLSEDIVSRIKNGQQSSGASMAIPTLAKDSSKGGGNVVNITVQGAVDPFNTARQIQRILAQGSRGGFSTLAA